jgi:hypothetical protein
MNFAAGEFWCSAASQEIKISINAPTVVRHPNRSGRIKQKPGVPPGALGAIQEFQFPESTELGRLVKPHRRGDCEFAWAFESPVARHSRIR